MPLNIYFRGVDVLPQLEVIDDVVARFYKRDLDGCEYDRRILKCIENCEFLDNIAFKDKHGKQWYMDVLSASTKCALLVYHNPNSIVNGVELRHSALRELLINCDRGNLLLPAQKFDFSCSSNDSAIDVVCSGKHYSSLHEIAEYLTGTLRIAFEYVSFPVVRVELDPGIYLLPEGFEREKAYMQRLFRDLSRTDRVTSHSFPIDDLYVDRVLNSDARDVVLFYRYDMCDVDCTKEMLSFAKTGVLLLDCQSHVDIHGLKECKFVMFGNELIIK